MDDEKTIWAEGLPETAEDKQRCAWTLADLPTGKEDWKYEYDTANKRFKQ